MKRWRWFETLTVSGSEEGGKVAVSVVTDPWRTFILCGADTAVTIPSAASLDIPTGYTYTVMDNAGTAGTTNIVVTCGTLVGGGTTSTISTNGGRKTFISCGGGS